MVVKEAVTLDCGMQGEAFPGHAERRGASFSRSESGCRIIVHIGRGLAELAKPVWVSSGCEYRHTYSHRGDSSARDDV